MDFQTEEVLLSQIDIKDETYLITTAQEDSSLALSIREVGLVNPPILRKCPSGSFRVVSGFRRLRACRDIGWVSVPVRLVPEDLSDEACTALAVYENVQTRPLNLIEQSRAMGLIGPGLPGSERVELIAKRLELPPNPAFIQQIENLCRLSQTIQEGILDGTISFSMAVLLGTLPNEEAEIFARLFFTLRPGLNKQREILNLIQEIGGRENMTPAEVIGDDAIQKILVDENLDRAQKTRKLRRVLKDRRYPNITRARDRFEQELAALGLGTKFTLTPSDHFEGRAYTFKFKFESLEELKERCRDLDALADHPTTAHILSRTFLYGS